jgi:hypothetical protein
MPTEYFNTAHCSAKEARAVKLLWQRLRVAAGAITFPDCGDSFDRIGD